MLRITKEELQQLYEKAKIEDFEHPADNDALIKGLEAFFYGRTITEEKEHQIKEAVRQYHIDRGCCDGTFVEPCAHWEGLHKETTNVEETNVAKPSKPRKPREPKEAPFVLE